MRHLRGQRQWSRPVVAKLAFEAAQWRHHSATVEARRNVDSDDTSPIRLFLLDDHEIVRRGLADLLNSEEDFEVVAEASTCEEALRRMPAVLPDVAILDGRLPDGSGIDVCRQIREQHPE